MADILNYIKNLFRDSDKKSTPFTHESLERSEEEFAAYVEWKESGKLNFILEHVKEEYKEALEQETSNYDFLVIHSPSTNGFIMSFQKNLFTGDTFRFFMDYLEEKVIENGYSSYFSDVKTHVKNDDVFREERHYLKPTFSFPAEGEKIDQLYGNIHITLIYKNEKPAQLKFIAHPYHDRKYHPPRKFEELMEEVLKG